MSVEQVEVGQRNSPYRVVSETLLDRPVRAFHKTFPKVKGKHISDAGERLIRGGVWVMEAQHRAKEYSPALTKVAGGLVVAGLLCDLFDGKLARLIRSEMTDPVEKYKDELEGQAYDPEVDGRIEAYQSQESAETARVLNRGFGVKAAKATLLTSNLARTAKSITGFITEASVPETYEPWKFKSFGTSIGRKALLFATFFPRLRISKNVELPVQEIVHTGVAVANTLVTVDRLSAAIHPNGNKRLSEKEVGFAGFRAARLGALSLENIGLALKS